jgi:hypothetical protein
VGKGGKIGEEVDVKIETKKKEAVQNVPPLVNT